MKKITLAALIFCICLFLPSVAFTANADSNYSFIKPGYIYYYPGSDIEPNSSVYPGVFFKKNDNDRIRHTFGNSVIEDIKEVDAGTIQVTMSHYGGKSVTLSVLLTKLKYSDFSAADTNKPFDGLYALTPTFINPSIFQPCYIIFIYSQEQKKIRFINLKTGSDVTLKAETKNKEVIIENGNKIIYHQISPAPLSGIYDFIKKDAPEFENDMPVLDVLGKYYDEIVNK